MNQLIIRISISLLFTMSALATGCFQSSSSRDSSGSNWLTCQTVDECGVDDAVSCSDDGYCLDKDGERIAVSALVDAENTGLERGPDHDAGDAMARVDADRADAEQLENDASIPAPPSDELCAWGVSDILAKASLVVPDRVNCGEYSALMIEPSGLDCFFDAIDNGQTVQITINYSLDDMNFTTYVATADEAYYAVLMEDGYFGDAWREAKLERCGKLTRSAPEPNDGFEDITCTPREELYQCTEPRSIARAYQIGDVPANGAPTTTLHLYISDQSFDNPVADLRIYIEETEVVRGQFAVEQRDNPIPFDIEVPVGTLNLRAFSGYAGGEHVESIDVPAERWAVLDYYYSHDDSGRDFSGEEIFTLSIYAEPIPKDGFPQVEPVSEQDYILRNNTNQELTLEATNLVDDDVTFLVDSVDPGTEAIIYHAIEGTGGHTLPSNFFRTFIIRTDGEVVYEGVENDDWLEEVSGLVLVIESPREQVDYSCQFAEDCSIENVGNCCGYYPRCVNKDSPLPGPVCSDGQSSVCGWSEISHCECVDNTCRSMQGDNEV